MMMTEWIILTFLIYILILTCVRLYVNSTNQEMIIEHLDYNEMTNVDCKGSCTTECDSGCCINGKCAKHGFPCWGWKKPGQEPWTKADMCKGEDNPKTWPDIRLFEGNPKKCDQSGLCDQCPEDDGGKNGGCCFRGYCHYARKCFTKDDSMCIGYTKDKPPQVGWTDWDKAPTGSCNGATCTATQECKNGVCVDKAPSCPEGQTQCDGECKNLQSDLSNCGSCKNVGPSSQTCEAGQCKTKCSDNEIWFDGVCTKCKPGQKSVDNQCVGDDPEGGLIEICARTDFANDDQHCGSCTRRCSADSKCVNGNCVPKTSITKRENTNCTIL